MTSIKPKTDKTSYPGAEALLRHHGNACCIDAAAILKAEPQQAGTAHKPAPPAAADSAGGIWNILGISDYSPIRTPELT